MKGKSAIAFIAVVVVFAAAVFVFLTRASTPKNAALSSRQHAMEMLGQSIAKLRPGAKILALSNPFTKEAGFLDEKAQFERAGLKGLRKGLGSDSSVTVVFPEIKAEFLSDPQSVFIPPDSRTPLSFLIRPGEADRLANEHPDCSVLVSLIGLPAGIEQTKIWQQEDKRSFALLLPDFRVLGAGPKAVDAFDRGKILATVAENAADSKEPLIVTRENVRDVLKRQPQALGY